MQALTANSSSNHAIRRHAFPQPPQRGSSENAPEFLNILCSHRTFLVGVGMTLRLQRSDAEDLAQDTILRAWRFRAHYEPGSNLRGWLATICKNIFRSNRRRERWLESRIALLSQETPHKEGISGDEALEPEYLRELIQSAPQNYREVLNEICSGDSYEAIAARMGIPMGTVKSRLNRARAWLLIDPEMRDRHAQASCRGGKKLRVRLGEAVA